MGRRDRRAGEPMWHLGWQSLVPRWQAGPNPDLTLTIGTTPPVILSS